MRRDLLALEPPLTPIPIDEIERRLGRRVIRLDTNENPYGPSPLVAEALARWRLERYPDPECRELRLGLSAYLDVPAERIVCGAGGDELIDLLLRLFLAPGDEVIDCVPSFVMYPLATTYNGGRYVPVPRGQNFAVDLVAVESAIRDRTKVIFLCSPNNPTGNPTPDADICWVLERGPIVVLDEAYAEFAGRTLVRLTDRYPNLIVLRTMSKWAAIAGVRLGYAVAHPSVVEAMAKISSPFHVSVPAQAAGIASLQDRDYLMANVGRIVEERERLADRLRALPYGRVYASETNFLYWESGSVKAPALRAAMAWRGVLVRTVGNGALRISVGTGAETDGVMAVLEESYGELAG